MHPGPRAAHLGAAALLALGAGLGSAALFDPDEPVYAQAGLEMLRRGEWLAPFYGGQPWFDKPVLFYALEAASQAVLGPTETAARLPSALAAAALAGLLAWGGRRWYGPGTGGWAAWISLTAVYSAVVARAAVTDSVLTLFLAAALLGFGELLAGRIRIGFPLACLGLALATLTKGPVAPALLALQVAAYAGAARTWAPLRNRAAWLAGLAGVGLAAPWYAYMEWRFPGHFLDAFLGQQNLVRFLQPEHAGRPLAYYLPRLPLMFLPWTLFVPLWLRRTGSTPAGGSFRPGAYLWTWVAVVTVFFSLSATKLPTYVLPAIPALALLLAQRLGRAGGFARRAAWVAGGVTAVALAAGATLLAPRLVCYYSAASIAPELRRIPAAEPLFVFRGGLPGTLYYAGRRNEPLDDPDEVRLALRGEGPCWLVVRQRHASKLTAELAALQRVAAPSGPWGNGLLLYHKPAKAAP